MNAVVFPTTDMTVNRDADFIRLPSTLSDGISSLFLFGGTPEQSLHNYAFPDAPDAIAVGNPVFGPQSIILNGGLDYLLLSRPQTTSITIILVSRILNDNAGGVLLCSNQLTDSQIHIGSTRGCSLYATQGNPNDGRLTPAFTVAKTLGSVSTPVQATGASNSLLTGRYYTLCGRLDASEGIRDLYNLASNTTVVSATDTDPIDLGGCLTLGCSSIASGFLGQSEHVICGIWPRKITDPERSSFISWGQSIADALPSPFSITTGV